MYLIPWPVYEPAGIVFIFLYHFRNILWPFWFFSHFDRPCFRFFSQLSTQERKKIFSTMLHSCCFLFLARPTVVMSCPTPEIWFCDLSWCCFDAADVEFTFPGIVNLAPDDFHVLFCSCMVGNRSIWYRWPCFSPKFRKVIHIH